MPYDYDDPDAGTFNLVLAKHEATGDRIGSLLVNPGGPGFGGTVLALSAESIYSDDILEHFDIIGWDPRGTGESTPAIDCVDDYDDYFAFDVPPSDEAEHEAIIEAGRAFGEECAAKNGDILPYVSHRGVGPRHGLDPPGARRGPDLVLRVLLRQRTGRGVDQAVPRHGARGGDRRRLRSERGRRPGRPRTRRRASNDSSTPSSPTAAATRRARSTTTATPRGRSTTCWPRSARIRSSSTPDRTPVTRGVAYTAVTDALYLQSSWPDLAQALADAADGDGSGLLAGFDSYYQRRPDGTYGNEIEAFNAISCIDDPGPRSVEGVDADIPAFLEVAPRLGASFAYGYVCALWPVEPVGQVDVTGAGNGPVVVIGTTGDPATPIESTEAMADTLADGRLIVVKADQHTGYGVNSCVDDAVDDYLVDLDAPDDGLKCT